MTDTILWHFIDSTGHPACLTLGDLLGFALMLLLLFLFCLLMAKRRQTCLRIRNYLLIPLAAVGGFVIYAIGYLHGGTASSLTALSIRSFLSTFHMFFLHSDLLEVCEEMHHDKVYMTFFSLIHFLAFLISFLVVVQLFGTHFLSWLRLKCTVPRRSYVFFGLDGASVALVRSLFERKEPGRLVVVLSKKGKNKSKAGEHGRSHENTVGTGEKQEIAREQLLKTDALLLNRVYSEETTFREAGIKKLLKKGEAHLFLFSGDTARNFRLALKMTDEIKDNKNYRAKIILYVRLDEEGLVELLESRTMPENMEIRIIRPAQLSAVELIRNYPPVDYVRVEPEKAVATKDFSVMILGFGETGSQVLRTLAEHGQFVGAEFHALVVDKNLDKLLGTFKSRYPGMEHYGVEYLSADVNSVVFWDILRTKLGTLDYLVVALGDSCRNMQVALDTERFIYRISGRKIDIFVKVGDDPIRIYSAWSALLSSGTIHAFGAESTIFTEDLIIHEAWWALAKKMHAYYNWQKEETLSKDTFKEVRETSGLNRKRTGKENVQIRKKNSVPGNKEQGCAGQKWMTSGGQIPDKQSRKVCSGDAFTGNSIREKWEQLPEIRKASNLSAALHVVTKLKLAGISPEKIKKLGSKDEFLDLLGEERQENLAKGEHLHWNATLFAQGWDTWTAIPGDASDNKNEGRKLHACLVDWEELPRIEARFDEPYREYDRIFVENIYDWMQDTPIFEEVEKQFSRKCSGKNKG